MAAPESYLQLVRPQLVNGSISVMFGVRRPNASGVLLYTGRRDAHLSVELIHGYLRISFKTGNQMGIRMRLPLLD